MTNGRKEQTRGVDRDDGKDRQPADAPDGSSTPDSVAPILQSEDKDELFDEDAPE
ncbi:hypothetical protein LMG28614_02446 [Paraburkholderia ultramafica]|uniref:Uncharacterized protein n=1 Tax=Paraburkholderia ultramafica TaxID=1544867 RepID=A0A6S7BFR1_9BURK|nr:hypothetical protein [Paraburkholderia ultramafica]CAB3787201.1 hypothetical protein LMG28614_02446 [Paraburkholderia ultramafica]